MSAAVATLVVPCRNAGPHLRSSLASLLAQSRQDFDLVLVDDASTDGSAEQARTLGGDRLRVLANAQPLGLGGNFARCAGLVATPFFALVHQDDVYHRDWFAALLAALERQPAAALAHCRAQAIDDRGAMRTSPAERYKTRLAARAAGADPAALYAALWRGNFVCCPSVLFRTEAYRRTGGFDPALAFALDWDLWFRLARGGGSFALVDRPLLQYRRHGGAASRDATRDLSRFREELLVLERARRDGVAAGLLPASIGPSPALRNNVLHEALEDLRAGDRPAMAQKLAFLREHVPALARDRWLLAFRGLARLGPPGRTLLGAGRALAVRFGLGGARG